MYQDTNSTWDYENHVAIPTLQYIQSITGYDLNTLGDSVPLSTESRVKGLTIESYQELLKRIPLQIDKKVLGYLIATEKDWRNDFIKYAVIYIKQTFIEPDWEVMPRQITNAILGSNLKSRQFDYSIRNEVENTEEVW